jgi:hypothetical protein
MQSGLPQFPMNNLGPINTGANLQPPGKVTIEQYPNVPPMDMARNIPAPNTHYMMEPPQPLVDYRQKQQQPSNYIEEEVKES